MCCILNLYASKKQASRLLWCQNDSQSILKFEAKEREEGERNGTRPLVYHDVIMCTCQFL
jgi:hypothetical protein